MATQEVQKPTPSATTMFQAFEWNVPPDGKHWKRLTRALPSLKAIGIDCLWLPPGCKASEPQGAGYDIYDLYDLGEFDQKGSRGTKWGPVEDLEALCTKAHELGLGLYWDAVLNHKAGADKTEKCMAVEVDTKDRDQETSEPYEIEAWFGFDFPGRGDKYSAQKYHWYHFSGTDYNAANGQKGIFKLKGEGKAWSRSVSSENGNADYMMFADLDYSHDEVCDDVKNWGVWITKRLGLSGFRLDAVQHFSERFTGEWVELLRQKCGNDIFVVGEYWSGDVDEMMEWLSAMENKFSLYDAPLLYNFARIAAEERGDLRSVFDRTVVQAEPVNAVTVVTNHDTQPGQTMDTPIAPFFKPLAYALILLRDEGYPCPFYGDLYGLQPFQGHPDPEPPACSGILPALILARKLYNYGAQDDYFDAPNCIGWVRRGAWDKPDGCAVVMSNAEACTKRMFVGEEKAGQTWTDVLGWARDGDEEAKVKIDEDGWGEFVCGDVSLSVWVNGEAEGRDRFPVEFDTDIYKED